MISKKLQIIGLDFLKVVLMAVAGHLPIIAFGLILYIFHLFGWFK